MREPGKLLFRVGHLSCLKGVMAAQDNPGMHNPEIGVDEGP